MSRHNFNKVINFHLILLIFLTSECSIFEQRSCCPCWVGLDFSPVLAQESLRNGEAKAIELSVFNERGEVAFSHSYGIDSCAPAYEIELPRGQYTVSAVIGNTSIGQNKQADTLLGKSLHLNAGNETAEAVIEPFKQYASVGIRVLSSPYDSLDITIKAPSAAVDRRTLEGLPQQYSCGGTFSGGSAGFNILRQAGGELQLSFSDATSGRHITDIDLGAWLKRIGYDFSAESLADIVLILDFHTGTASLSIEGWLDAPTYYMIF